MLIIGRILIFVALWLAFEFWISWAAFCNQSGAYLDECVFRGPVSSMVRSLAHWWSEFHEWDALVALFTLFLSISTTLLWLSTRRLWQVTRIHAEHIPRVERAYVSGGSPWKDDSLTQLRVTIDNYGKTPAFVGTVIIGMIGAGSPVPEEPVYAGKDEFLGAFVKPNVTLQTNIFISCPPDGRIVYGRIYYRDIFEECYSSGFALRALPYMPAAPVPDAYWARRKETDLGPAAGWSKTP